MGLQRVGHDWATFTFTFNYLSLTFTNKEKETQGADRARFAHSFIRYYLTIKTTCQASPDSDNEWRKWTLPLMPRTPKGSTMQRSAGWTREELTGLGVAPPSSRAWNRHLLGLLGLVPRVKVTILVTQSCPTLCDPMDCSPPGSSVHGILQARLLEWVAKSFSRGSSWLRDQAWVSCIASRDSLPSEPLAHQTAPLSDPNFQRGTSQQPAPTGHTSTLSARVTLVSLSPLASGTPLSRVF